MTENREDFFEAALYWALKLAKALLFGLWNALRIARYWSSKVRYSFMSISIKGRFEFKKTLVRCTWLRKSLAVFALSSISVWFEQFGLSGISWFSTFGWCDKTQPKSAEKSGTFGAKWADFKLCLAWLRMEPLNDLFGCGKLTSDKKVASKSSSSETASIDGRDAFLAAFVKRVVAEVTKLKFALFAIWLSDEFNLELSSARPIRSFDKMHPKKRKKREYKSGL